MRLKDEANDQASITTKHGTTIQYMLLAIAAFEMSLSLHENHATRTLRPIAVERSATAIAEPRWMQAP